MGEGKDQEEIKDETMWVDYEQSMLDHGSESAGEEYVTSTKGAMASSASLASTSARQDSSTEDEADYDDHPIHPELKKELTR